MTTLPADTDVRQVVDIIERDGGVIVAGFLHADGLVRLRKEVNAALDEIRPGEDAAFAGTRTRRAGRLFARSTMMVDIARHPLYLGAARAILQKPVDVWFGQERTTVTPGIQIGMTQAIRICPGQGTQPLHRDDTSFLWRHPDYGREGRLQIMVAVNDFTQENGATRVIPGSHRWDDERMPLNEETVPAAMAAGSALLWIGSTYHGGGNNVSTGDRTGVTMSFDLSNLRQEENQYLSLSPEVVSALPQDVQRLLGWSSGDNFMGYIEVGGQMTDPNFLVATS
ncbi:phytanoyl-CoA dioxygenase family protein [Kineococcus rhizosphaerae]|uniref:phytanoyl-CoA dioxygenase family protein n=1 Tax=Kineococcus rhizosphaerae TaxID=559628 RepID=UPI0031837A30